MRVPMVKRLMGPREQVSSSWLGRPFLKAETPSPRMFMGIIVRMCPTNMRVFCRLLEDIEQL